MSGIDKIIQQIEDDTKTVCDEIIAKAENQAARIRQAGADEAAAIADEAEKKLSLRLKDIEARGESAAALEEKRVMLNAKQQIIFEMLEKGKQSLRELPDDAYFALIIEMVRKNALDKDGIIRFNEKDLGRIPAGFEQQLNEAARGRLTLSKEPIAIDAGFVLIYGGIEENCSFEAVFASASESLSDRASSLLF